MGFFSDFPRDLASDNRGYEIDSKLLDGWLRAQMVMLQLA